MNGGAARANCFDASALVKLHIAESGSEIVRSYFDREATKYCTPFCFYEALSVLKVKWRYRKEITKYQYITASFRLAAWYGASSEKVKDLELASPTVLIEARRLVEKTAIDLSDAFQILSVKLGYFSRLIGDSRTVLVTADNDLAIAARDEGIRVWNFMKEPEP